LDNQTSCRFSSAKKNKSEKFSKFNDKVAFFPKFGRNISDNLKAFRPLRKIVFDREEHEESTALRGKRIVLAFPFSAIQRSH
jgi:hypothetical protein